jgi:hypothetical protein
MNIFVLGPIHGATSSVLLTNVHNNYKIIPAKQVIPDYDPRYNAEFANQLGSLNMIKLRDSPCFYASGNTEHIFPILGCSNIKELLSQQSNLIDNYFSLLWFQFDNAVYTNELYVFTEDGRVEGINSYFASSNSFNGFDPIELTQEHIEIINKHEEVFRKVRSLGTYHSKDKMTFSESEHVQNHSYVAPPTMEKYSFSRLIRAHVLLRQARASSMKPVKATFYSILLECLLSSDDNAEVSHKVAERASLFIGQSDEDRIEIFRQIKKFYGLRSKFVHGQNIKQKLVDFEGLAGYIDEVIRSIFNKILSDPRLVEIYGREDGDKAFDAYFLGLLFSR